MKAAPGTTAPEPAPDPNDVAVDEPLAEAAEAAGDEEALELDDAALVEVEDDPVPRRGILPPPASPGKRVAPLSAKGTIHAKRPERPSAAGLPSGMRPPGAPEPTEPENTDVLIASAVAALTDEVPVVEKPVEAAPPTPEEPPLPPAPEAPPAPEPSERRPPWLIIGAAAAAVVLLGVFALSGSDEATVAPATPPPASQAPAVAAPAPTVEPVASARLDLGAPPALDATPDVGLVEDERLDLGSAFEPKLDVGGEEVVALLDEPPAAEVPSAKPRKRQRKSSKAAPATAAPPPPPPKAPPDAAALLADARKALASGDARRAYALAVKSRKAKSSSAALVVMAKAACRFGGERQAKSAFGQLRVSDRRGIRAECRKRGIRLGL